MVTQSRRPLLAATMFTLHSAHSVQTSLVICKECRVLGNKGLIRSSGKLCSAAKPRPPVARSIATDSAVPEGHQELHGYLYGETTGDTHSANGYQFREDEDDGSTLLSVSTYVDSRDGEKPLGVYALYDKHRDLQYVGYSRNVVLATKGHLKLVGEDKCAYIRVMVFRNKAMATRANLERQVQNWINECGTIPPGNGAERHLWETVDPPTKTMSAAELAEYEEKKIKLKKAMGDIVDSDSDGDEDDAATRRLKLIQAVQGDDWSAVIDAQNKETLQRPTAVTVAGKNAQVPVDAAVVSPFSRANVHRKIGDAALAVLELNIANVDAALEEVRPYLIADGGNVEVADVKNGVVMLRLQGACGTCPSSSATMKMGIERSLQSKFGDQLKEVIQVGGIDTTVASVDTVDQHLNMIRPAIHNFGGSVEVVEVANGVCKLKYAGPKPIGHGVVAAVKDQFKELRQVILVD